MATQYIQKFDTLAAFIASAPDNGGAQGVGSVDGQLVVNQSGTAQPVGVPAPVVLTTTTTLNRTNHANRTLLSALAAGVALTLPAATGSGDKYRVVVSVLLTRAATTLTCPSGTILNGMALINNIGDSSAATVDAYPTGASDEIFSFTQSLGAGKIGDWVEVEDIATGIYAVSAHIQGEADPATPFASS